METSDDLKDKSCQGRIFDERDLSFAQCLKGDEDVDNQVISHQHNSNLEQAKQNIKSEINSIKLHNIPFSNSQEMCSFIQTKQSNEIKTIENINQDLENIPNYSNQSFFLTNQNREVNVANILCENDINDVNNINNQNTINKEEVENRISIQRINNDFLDLQLNLNNDKAQNEILEIIQNQDNVKKSQNKIEILSKNYQTSKLGSSISNSRNVFIRKGTVHNQQKAAQIINAVFKKSMNRMQRINKYVQTFIGYLKQRTKDRKLPNLQENEYRLINDSTYYFTKRSEFSIIRKIYLSLYTIAHFRNPIPVFMPTDIFRVSWDIFQVTFTYFFIYFYSILIFFAQNDRDTEFIQSFFKFTLIIFLFDVLVNFNTAYFDKDIIVINRNKIAKKYILSHVFLTDNISLIIMGSKVIFQSTSLVYNPDNNLTTFVINLLIFLKLNGISLKTDRFSYVFTLKENQKHIIRLLNQLFSVISIAHIGWYCVGLYERENEYSISWLQKANLEQAKYYEKYIFSLYWSITTMTTVGYGDISATNYVEATFVSINMILFSCVFAYSINNIGFILQEIQKTSKILNDNITTMQRYLNRKNVNLSLQSRVRHYLSFLAEEQKNRDQKSENEILSVLSNKLRNEITLEINQRVLKKFRIFTANFSTQTLRKLVFIMQEVLISPNEIIFEERDIDDNSIYMIEGGIIEIYKLPINNENNSNNIPSRVHVIKTLMQNDLFGDISFFSGLARQACARSVNLSTLYKINRNQFIDILLENPEDFQRFKMLEEQVKVQNDLFSIFIECYVCKKLGHIASNCPNIHQIIDNQFFILKQNFTLFQDRLNTQRRKQKLELNIRFSLKKNLELCKLLKENLRNYNSLTKIMFNSEIDKQSQSSYGSDEIFQESDYYCTTSDSSQSQSSSQSSVSSSSNPPPLPPPHQFTPPSQSSSQNNLDQSIHKRVSIPQKNQKKEKNKTRINNVVKGKQSLKKQISTKKEESRGNIPSFREIEYYEQLQPIVKSIIQNNQKSCVRHSIQMNNTNEEVESNLLNNNSIVEKQIQQSNLDNINDEINNDSYSQNNKSQRNSRQHSSRILITTQQISSLNNINHDTNCENKKNIYPNKQRKFSIQSTKQKKNSELEFNHNDSETVQRSLLNRNSTKQIKSPKIQSYKKTSTQIYQKNPDKELRYSIDNMLNNSFQVALLASGIVQAAYQMEMRQNKKIDQNKEISGKVIDDKISTILNKNFKSGRSISDQIQHSTTTFTHQSSIFKKQTDYQDFITQFSQDVSPTSNILIPSTNNNNNNNSNNNKMNSSQMLKSSEIKNNSTSQVNKLQDSCTILERISRLLGMSTNISNTHQLGGNLIIQNITDPLIIMDFFDLMRNYTKFFPHNNFNNIMSLMKNKQNVARKQKKQKTNSTFSKSRRGNFIFEMDTKNNTLYFISKLNQEGINLNIYKPTYVSYGVSQRNETVYPKIKLKTDNPGNVEKSENEYLKFQSKKDLNFREVSVQ